MQGHVVHPNWTHTKSSLAFHINIIPILLQGQSSSLRIQFIHNPTFILHTSRRHSPGESYISKMAAMATASMMQTANLAIDINCKSTKVSATSNVRMGALRFSTHRASGFRVRAAGNPERIDNFVEGAKSDASKNASNFGKAVAEKVGDVERTVKDVGRDMGAKAQEAVDAANKKVDEAGDKANEVGDEVKTSTRNTLDSATSTRDGQSVVEKAQNAAGNVGDNLKQNVDYGVGAVENAADDASKDAKKSM